MGHSIHEPTDNQPRYKTIAEIADQFQLSVATIRRYIADGRLTAYQVGPRRVRLDPVEVSQQLVTRKSGVRECAPLTADEAALIRESLVLDQLIVDSRPGDDTEELSRRRDRVLVAIRDRCRAQLEASQG